MLTADKFKSHCAQLVNPSVTDEKRKELATEIRDSIEIAHSQEYGPFLANFLPAFEVVLTSLTQPQLVDNTVHQTRAVILEILHKLPPNDILRPRFLDVFALALQILQTDNEDNAVTAVHIIFDLHKNLGRQQSGSHVQPFVDYVRQLYESFPNTVKTLLLTKRSPEGTGHASPRRIPVSSQSFKVLAECPLVVMFVFQLNPQFIKTNIQRLLPLMVRTIEMEIPPQTIAIVPKTLYQDFVAAQVKTLSFLAYLLKQFPDLMKADDMTVPRSAIKLFQCCPVDSVPIRRDLLVASRNILATNFRHYFFGYVDLLLEARILLGTGKGGANVLRPLAYTFVAELVHRVRLNLSISQLEKIISIFSTNLHDPTLTFSMQTSAVRLLLNLIEGIWDGKNDDTTRNAAARELLLRILDTMVTKYVTLGAQVPRLLKSVEVLRVRPNPIESGQRLCEVVIGDPMKEIADFKALVKTLTLGLKTVIWSVIKIRVSGPTFQKASTGPGAPSSVPDSTTAAQGNALPARPGTRAGLLERECELVAQLFGAGQNCFRLYSQLGDQYRSSAHANGDITARKAENMDAKSDSVASEVDSEFSFLGPTPKIEVASPQEEREVIDQFAQIFTILDIRSFQDVFGLRMGDLFDHIVENPAALMIPQHFLANNNISKYFADILLSFLVDNLSMFDVPLSRADAPSTRKERTAQTLLKLFKILFVSVTLFPTNEPVLRLHIVTIVGKCLNYAKRVRDPHNYLQMLRALFKALTNQKAKVQFELLYREFMPLVEPLFEELLSLFKGPNRLVHGELIAELCLMIPARPSTIFPYLDHQIKPIVWALKGGKDTVLYGLRTLDFWVDMLQPGYLDRLLARVEPDLSTSLYRLLRLPHSKTVYETTVGILGKLGSRARVHKALESALEAIPDSHPAQQVSLSWPDGSVLLLETDNLIRLSADALLNNRRVGLEHATADHKAEAWKFLYACLCPFLGIVGNSPVSLSGNCSDGSFSGIWNLSGATRGATADAIRLRRTGFKKSRHQERAESRLVKTILVALIGSWGSNDVQKAVGELPGSGVGARQSIHDMSRYFAVLTVQSRELQAREGHPPFSIGPSKSRDRMEPGYLSHALFLDAISTVLSLEDRAMSSSGLECLQAYVSGLYDCCRTSKNNAPEPIAANPSLNQSDRVASADADMIRGDDQKSMLPNESGRIRVELKGGIEDSSPSRMGESPPNARNAEDKDVIMADTNSEGPGEKEMSGGDITDLKDDYMLARSISAVVDRLCHCCYQRSWNGKWAGTYGLAVVVEHVEEEIIASPAFASNVIHIVRALLFVMRGDTGAAEDEIVERARTVLNKLFRGCFARRGAGDSAQELAPEVSKVLTETTVRLTMDLTCDSAHARETARQCLRTLGKTLKCDVAKILSADSCKEQLLRPLMQRPVRQQPFPVQTGYIEAVSFCLQLKRPLLSEELFSSRLRSVFLSDVITVSEDQAIERLTEAEEGIRNKLVENRVISPTTMKALLTLRRKTVELLCHITIHCSSSLREARNDELFRRIISSFFKNLQSKDDNIVESAKRGLKQAISKHQKPKDLLQDNLRPILSNLGDYKKLTMHYVQGLSRVLELFSHWFNVNLGEKLLEHLQRWTEPEKLAQLKRWTPGTEARVGAAILNLFHLLPPTASRLLEKIVSMVIRLESVLAVAGPGVAHLGLGSAKAASTSPYREPLLKYCNQHAAASVDFFLLHLDDDLRRQLFFVMIRSTESGPLRKNLMEDSKRLVSPTFLSVEGMGSKSLHIITVIDLVSRHDAQWLGRDPELILKLSSYWKTATSFTEVKDDSVSSLGRVLEVKTLAEIFIRYCSSFPNETSVLFELLAVFSTRTTCDFSFVKDFLNQSVTKPGLPTSRRAIIAKLLSLFQDKTVSHERKVHALQYIVIPMLEHHLEERKKQYGEATASTKNGSSPDGKRNVTLDIPRTRDRSEATEEKPNLTEEGCAASMPTHVVESGDASKRGVLESQQSSTSGQQAAGELNDRTDGKGELSSMPSDPVLDAGMLQRIMKELLDQPDEVLQNYDEPLSAELLRLATILIRYMPHELSRYRKELIKFGWNHLKREDSIAKQRAFVNVSRFFEAYPAPAKIILQVFVALLRACQGDGRELVQEALDILTPALPRRLEHKPTDHKYPLWIRYTKKILLEEGHNPTNLVHICQLIARHASLFYVARAQFVPLMVNSITRLGLNTTAGPENRRLALDLVDLVIKWERTRLDKRDQNVARSSSETHGIDLQTSDKKRTRDEDGESRLAVSDSTERKDQAQTAEPDGEPPAKTRKLNDSQSLLSRRNPGTGHRDTEDFKPTTAMTDVLVQFLVQIAFRSMDRREGPLVTKRCIVLLKEASRLWPASTARLAFVEKLLRAPGSDRLGALSQQNREAKGAGNQESQDLANGDSKNLSKGETPRNEKAEQARLKWNAARHAALSTALGLTHVLTKCQGRRFVEANVLGIRALILPAITEGNLQTCKLFAVLLKDLIRVCPLPFSGHPDVDSTKEKGSTKVQSGPAEMPAAKGHSFGDEKPARSQSDQLSNGTSDNAVKHIYKAVYEAIDVSLKAPDVFRNYCALLILQVLSDYAPQQFVKYQDVMIKIFHRMTKENLHANQQLQGMFLAPSSAGGNAVGNRVGNGTDRNVAGAAASSAVRTGTFEALHMQDAGRTSKPQGADESSSRKNNETLTLTRLLSLLGDNIITLEHTQRKTLFQCLWALIDRCGQVEILLEMVKVVRSWVFWSPGKEKMSGTQKEPLSAKEKIQILVKMVVFERIKGTGSQQLMKAYLEVILRIFGGEERRPEILPKLEKAFMLGMKAPESETREQFFRIYNASIARSLPMRLAFVLAKQEWEHLADVFWIKHATEVLLGAADHEKLLATSSDSSAFPPIDQETRSIFVGDSLVVNKLLEGPPRKVKAGQTAVVVDPSVLRFCRFQCSRSGQGLLVPLQALFHYDSELAYHAWLDLLPKAWAALSHPERLSLEKSIPPLLAKEYHQIQRSWPRNNIQALLGSFLRCNPLPAIRADLIFHLGSRWNAWHTALHYLDGREHNLLEKLKSALSGSDEKQCQRIRVELEDIADSRTELYRSLHERDFLAGCWKLRAKSPLTKKALTFEQLAKYSQAQNLYGTAMAKQLSSGDGLDFNDARKESFELPGKAEACFWEERWIDCARKLCQWEVLTEFARVVVNSDLLHECLWRVPDWSALKELLIKNPVEDGPQLKLYQAYVQLQENKLDVANERITQGFQKALERYCALPESGDLDAYGPVLVQFQQLVELQESSRILGELNALSRHGSGSINVEQKIDSVRLVLNTWRERLPSQHESLTVWNDVLTWRNHVHAVVVNVLDALKEAASAKVAAAQAPTNGSSATNRNINGLHAQTPQVQAAAAIAQALPQQVLVMGVNETAWNVHRFAKACRKQGFPDMALYALQKLYPFGTMELTEYFVKTKETARSFMANPLGMENGTEYGLHELNRCNMDHFNARQKAQLFTVRGQLCAALGREDDAVDAFAVALSTSSDVGSAWLAWGLYCDMLQERFSKNSPHYHSKDVRESKKAVDTSHVEFETALEWREAAVNCYLQAVRFGSRKSRLYLPRVLRLLTSDVLIRLHANARKQSMITSEEGNVSTSGTMQAKGENIVAQKATTVAPGRTPLPESGDKGASGTIGPSGTAGSGVASKQPPLDVGVGRVIAGLIPEIPAWMWLPWLPQLVLMLCRSEGIIIRPILVQLAQLYPQALFLPIRAFMEERKPIDRPEKILSKEALKMGRPVTSALLPSASSAQVAAARQIQAAKENFQRAQQRHHMIQKGLQRTEAAISANPGTADQSALIAKKVQLEEDRMNAYRFQEKCMREYGAAQHRHKQLLERRSSAVGTGSTGEIPVPKKQTEDSNKGQKDAVKTEDVQVPSASESVGENRTAISTPKKPGLNGASEAVRTLPPGSQVGEGQVSSNKYAPGTPFGHADYVMAHVVRSHQLVYLEVERIAIELSYRLKPQREEHLLNLMNALLHRCYQYPVKMGKEVAPSFRSALEEVSRMCFGTGLDSREKSVEQNVQSGITDLKDAFEADLAPQVSKDFPSEIEPFIARLRRWHGIFQRRVEAMPDFLKLESISRHLIESKHSDVEVFGQYMDVDVSEPDTERHVKIQRFSADVRVVRRQAGPCRGIRIIGSDGKPYDFVHETSINASSQSTEDRSMQLCRLLNATVFAKDSEAHRRRIQLTIPTFVVIGARSRLVSDDPNLSSLAEGLEQYLDSREKAADDPLMTFRTLASEAYSRRRASPAKETSRAESIAARVDAYHEVCESHVPDVCLSDWVRSRMPNATSDFNFRKRFAETLGATSVVSYSLAIGARKPQSVVFSWASGKIHNVSMRVLTSAKGVLENDEAVPFRFTRNLRHTLGVSGLEGPFYGSMAVTLQSLAQSFAIVRMFLDIIVRDELIGWISTKSDTARTRSGSEFGVGGISEKEVSMLEDRLSASVSAVASRLKCDPPDHVGHYSTVQLNTEGLADYVYELIAKASKPENLAQMESSWQAWY